MREFGTLGRRKVVLGMVHLPPLPGTPFHQEGSFGQIVEVAVRSACALAEGGADGCLVQTVDRVYYPGEDSDPARTASMAVVVNDIARAVGEDFQVGVHMIRNALMASLGVATVAGGSYIRASALVGATLSADGMVEGRPLEVMEYRAKISAQRIKIIAEVESMHFRWLGGDKPVAQVALAAVSAGADAVAVADRDEARVLDMIAAIRAAVPGVPVILAGYTTHQNAARLLAAADGAFVGTCLEAGGWGGPIDAGRVRAYMDIVRGLD
jgi:uncharacterized protein